MQLTVSQSNSNDQTIDPTDGSGSNLHITTDDKPVTETTEEDPVDARSIPKFWLVKGEDRNIESVNFQPTELLTLVIINTGNSRSTHVTMIDNLGQNRYSGRSGGKSHIWTTRLQDTRCFGKWTFEVEGPLPDTEKPFEMDIHFNIVETLPDDLEETQVWIIETEDGVKVSYEPIIEEIDDEVEEELEEEEIEEFAEVDEEMIPSVPYTNKDIPLLEIPVSEISGIGPTYEKRLNAEDIQYIHDIWEREASTIASISNASESKAEKWLEQAQQIVNNTENSIYIKYKTKKEEEVSVEATVVPGELTFENEDLPELQIPVSEISGIGPTYQKRLSEHNINHVHDILLHPKSVLAEISKASEKKCSSWISQANEIGNNADNEIYRKYKPIEGERKFIPELLPEADLTNIKGVGPTTAEKISDAGYVTVGDLANASIIEFVEKSGYGFAKCLSWIIEANLKLKGVVDIHLDGSGHIRDDMLRGVSEQPDLNILSGVGASTAQKFEDNGIATIHALSLAEPKKLSAQLKMNVMKVAGWIATAQLVDKDSIDIHFEE